ncbi:hypothetical protein KC19_4G024300 [Ceratodon purpureus]|uniref:Uncharacterized protein n=1 Tax=Ceratodon purpureus TaxID=3225 RepID=A0A8T0I5T6_CERPU|nr:hypothetical protein KC19_4G024300 [Ceratodon purpureus]
MVTEVWQKWEVYQTAWSNFLQKYGKRDTDITSSNSDDGEEISFQDVPWPLMKEGQVKMARIYCLASFIYQATTCIALSNKNDFGGTLTNSFKHSAVGFQYRREMLFFWV